MQRDAFVDPALGRQGRVVRVAPRARRADDRDLVAAAEYLRTRLDVDPDRIRAIGFSIDRRPAA